MSVSQVEFMRQVVRHIKIEPAVKTETKRIALSVVAMSVVMEIVFLALGRFDSTVLFGNLLGDVYKRQLLYQAPFGNGGDSAHRL